jgi:hypothetical protein
VLLYVSIFNLKMQQEGASFQATMNFQLYFMSWLRLADDYGAKISASDCL